MMFGRWRGMAARRRLTSTGNVHDGPFFSPDGKTVAYGALLEGEEDIYTVPAAGPNFHKRDALGR